MRGSTCIEVARTKLGISEDIKRKRGEARYHLLRNEMLSMKEDR
jgi:hypothetical protein